MRAQDAARLTEKYRADDGRSLDDRFADALGLGLRYLRGLQLEIDGDRDEAHHGIRWWVLPLRQRVTIGDYLLDCVKAIEVNAIEAQLHFWEWLDWSDKEDVFIGRSEVRLGQNPPVRLPARTAPADDLHEYMLSLHTAGILRGLGSALDCLAAVIVGVLPLARPIMRASFTRDLLEALSSLPSTTQAATAGERLQGTFRDAFVEELRTAGPNHWHEWIIGYRNMLVHRGRRMGTSALVPSAGPPIRAHAVRVLPSEPELSQVEAWARWGDLIGCGQGSYFLRERAEETLRRALGAVTRLAARTCEHLLPVWRARRADPAALPQPMRQWDRIPMLDPSGFEGFLPGSFELQPDVMVGGPDIQRRMRVAAIDDSSRHLWRTP